RGYAQNSLGPRDIATGYPIGGRELLVGSIETATPLWSGDFDPQRGRLVGLFFIDGGNVWNGMNGGTGPSRARFSFGTGVGWQMPFGTIKLNLALPIKRYSGDSYQPVQFQFNAGF
ncbi:MAG: BamA/TamA family outer membrane protein, partial [Burkholderiaceae bacterium]|nr:BamA/TamA family outer membrane protein [Burkholderiaceae bacterium]